MKKYTIANQPVGKGATSLVYSSTNEQNEKVVLKKLENMQEAEHEASILKSLPVHKHIITMLDYFTENQTGYIVLELHEGERLGYFKKGSIHEQSLALQITINILKGLKVIHQQGILHCDISPHNILISDNDPQTVKIIDFGSSVRTDEAGKYQGNHKGATKWYRPPELKKQNNDFAADLNYSSDLYSAASVCLYLLNGQAPFRKKQACERIENKDLQKVLRKATRKNKQKRYSSAQELIDALSLFS